MPSETLREQRSKRSCTGGYSRYCNVEDSLTESCPHRLLPAKITVHACACPDCVLVDQCSRFCKCAVRNIWNRWMFPLYVSMPVLLLVIRTGLWSLEGACPRDHSKHHCPPERSYSELHFCLAWAETIFFRPPWGSTRLSLRREDFSFGHR